MSLRFFEGQDHAKIYAQIRPTTPNEVVQKLVAFLREKYSGSLDLAVDLGCGNGQCTFTLTSHFASVLGTDISSAQISEATEWARKLNCENVRFEAAPAEAIPVADPSVQLITICEAAHWMDLPKVYLEAKRVLSPNGIFAIIGYHIPFYTIKNQKDSPKNEAIKKLVNEAQERVLKYFPPKALSLFTEYADAVLPFSDVKRASQIPLIRAAKLASIGHLIRSYSPFVTLCKKEGDTAGEEFLKQLQDGIVAIINEGRESPLTEEEEKEYELDEIHNYFFIAGRA